MLQLYKIKMILGIGIDLIEIERIQNVGIERLAQRILTTLELQELSTQPPHRKLEMLAGRFVAKEAISKALGCGIGKIFSFYDAEILCDGMGKPHATVTATVLDHLYPDKEVCVHISITHSRGLASAMALVEKYNK